MQDLLHSLQASLDELREAAEAAVELSDRVPDLAPGMTVEDMARLAVVLRETRDAVSRAKTRCTFARDKLDEHFARKIAFDLGDTCYRTDDHTFVVDARGFFGIPSPEKDPDAVHRVAAWIEAKGLDPYRVLMRKSEFDSLCEETLAEGEDLPKEVRQHTVARVQVRRKNR